MKKWYLLAATVCALGLLAPSAAFAGKGKNKDKADAAPDQFSMYDKNGNGVLDADEKAALKKDFDKEPTGPLKIYDTNADGKLSEEELANIKPAPVKKHKKKNQ